MYVKGGWFSDDNIFLRHIFWIFTTSCKEQRIFMSDKLCWQVLECLKKSRVKIKKGLIYLIINSRRISTKNKSPREIFLHLPSNSCLFIVTHALPLNCVHKTSTKVLELFSRFTKLFFRRHFSPTAVEDIIFTFNEWRNRFGKVYFSNVSKR